MDTTDPWISFDDEGICNHCRTYDKNISDFNVMYPNKEAALDEWVKRIKHDGIGKEYDCILGISGGVDSAYLAYLSKKLGLRVLAVHVDTGWNSEVAVSNINKLCEKLELDLHTIVIDWPTMKELQRAYMFSGIRNLDIPQDHSYLSLTYKLAKKYKIKYMLNGSNWATEGILPLAWGNDAKDTTFIKDIYKKCGRNRISLKKYELMGRIDYIKYQYLNSVVRVNLLDFVDYSKKGAIALLEKEFGWEYYGGKHFESRFTKYFQGAYLPEKFGYDKKRAHLSSLIVGGEMSREEALAEMDDDSDYPQSQKDEDLQYILKKLDISEAEWEEIMAMPMKDERDYKTNKRYMNIMRTIKHSLPIIKDKKWF